MFNKFSFFATRMSQVQGSDAQNFRRGKGVRYQFCSEIYGLQETVGVTFFSIMARPKSGQDFHH